MDGKNLKDLRLRRHLSIDTIARSVGIHPDTLRALEAEELVGDVALLDELEDAILAIQRRPAIDAAKSWRRNNAAWLAVFSLAVGLGALLGALAGMLAAGR